MKNVIFICFNIKQTEVKKIKIQTLETVYEIQRERYKV